MRGTIARIRHELADSVDYEIVVVDHGSTDATVQLAESEGARVLVQPYGTIGSLRNAGVRAASGAFLVFLDADIRVTAEWAAELPSVLAALRNEPRTLTGWMYGLPPGAGWIEQSWYDPQQRQHRITYLETGNLITTRTFFDELGGFDESLRTGEDYDLSLRAVAAGGRIEPRPRLSVQHLGYPATIRGFVATEMWHGHGDTTSVAGVLHSKVALLALLFAGLHVVLVYGLAMHSPQLTVWSALTLAGICFLSAVIKYRGRSVRSILTNALLYYFYFAGRALAFLNFEQKHVRPANSAQLRDGTSSPLVGLR